MSISKLKYPFYILLGTYACMIIWKLLHLNSFIHFYMDYFFLAVRRISLIVLHWIPFPVVYFILPMLVYLLVYFIYRTIKFKTVRAIKHLLCYMFGLYMSFFVFWGFVYSAPTISQQFSLSQQEVDESLIFSRLAQETKRLDSLNTLYHQQVALMGTVAMEHSVREALNAFLISHHLPVFPKVRVREIKSGLLLRLETSGVYLPYAFEGHYDAGLHPIQKPFTSCHEMLHGYGYGQESDCNFFAYLACRNSKSIELKYSAQMAYWRYLAGTCRRINSEKYRKFYSSLSQNILSDLQSIREKHQVYKPILGSFKDRFYDWYLKSNGVKDGIKNYSAFINMVESWRLKYPEEFVDF